MTLSTRRFQPLFIFLSLLALLVALCAGWIRLGWHLPHFSLALPYTHGPLGGTILFYFATTVAQLAFSPRLRRA